MRITCWIPEDTNTHSEYVILIACLLRYWLHDSASVLRYTYSTLPAFFHKEVTFVGYLSLADFKETTFWPLLTPLLIQQRAGIRDT